MPIRYRSRWESFTLYFMCLLLVPLFSMILFLTDASLQEWGIFMACILGGCTMLILIVYWTTEYTIDGEYLRYRSLVFFGKARIRDIHKLDVGKTLHVGMRPAIARHGIIVYYNRYDEFYISPTDNASFVQELLKINPAIQVTYHTKK
ncbi:PH domain-containing protein [Sphingobacterium lactis]|uniref:PH domain-containing protein n=1 Tax=Sphingobacterium lactis TaxID=797291 RepID=UPI003DA68F0E